MADDSENDWKSKALKNYERNLKYAKVPKGGYITKLNQAQEQQFSAWLKANNVLYDVAAAAAGYGDYDMPGFWLALQAGDQKAKSAIDPNDKQIHYPDYWKTPYHETFSAESQWAGPGAPRWNDKDQLVMPDGTIVYDDKKSNDVKPSKSETMNLGSDTALLYGAV